MPDPIFADPRLAAIYDDVDGDRGDLDHYEAIVDELGARSVLDIGCGTGAFGCRLAARGLTVVGVDPAQASLDVARFKDGADRVTWLLGDATTLPAMQVAVATMTGNVATAFLTDEEWFATLSARATPCARVGTWCSRCAIRRIELGRSGQQKLRGRSAPRAPAGSSTGCRSPASACPRVISSQLPIPRQRRHRDLGLDASVPRSPRDHLGATRERLHRQRDPRRSRPTRPRVRVRLPSQPSAAALGGTVCFVEEHVDDIRFAVGVRGAVISEFAGQLLLDRLVSGTSGGTSTKEVSQA